MHQQSIQAVALAAVAACTLTLTNAASAAGVRYHADCTPVLTGFDRALYEKADESTAALRRHMEVRRSFLQQDIYDTAVWAAGVAEGRKRCIGSHQVAANGSSTATRP